MRIWKLELTGNWDTTVLYRDGVQVDAGGLLIEINADGGIANGGDLTAYVLAPDNPDQQVPIFPGRFEVVTQKGAFLIENEHPDVDFAFTRIWHHDPSTGGAQQEITTALHKLQITVNPPTEASAWIEFQKAHFLSKEIVTVTL